MLWTKFRTTPIAFCLAFVLGLLLFSLPTRVIAQSSPLPVQEQSLASQPPAQLALHLNNQRRRLPGRREPAAGRGCGLSTPQPSLTALSPESNIGLTVAAYPTFLFYIPQTSAKAVQFALVKEDKIKVYEQTFPTPNIAGIFSLNLSDNKTLPPLEIGKDYHWYLKVICADEVSGYIYVDGWVQRIKPSSNPMSHVEKSSAHELWYDTLENLAQKRRANPNDGAIATVWQNLLNSEGLSAISQKPIVGRLSSTKS
jgi:hypothetical protein